MSDKFKEKAEAYLTFEESSTDIDNAHVARLAEQFEQVALEESIWWHKEWHQATGIPCDGGSDYCPLSRRNR